MKLDKVLDLIKEKKSSDSGYKAMATSAGVKEWPKVKKYLKSKKTKEAMKDVKKRAEKAEDPEAYTAAVERKMVSGHFKK